jgi:hypothetical protein
MFFLAVCFLVVVVGVLTGGWGVCRDGSKRGSRSNSSLEQPYPSSPQTPTAKNLKRKKKIKIGTHVITYIHIQHFQVGTTLVGRLPGLAG